MNINITIQAPELAKALEGLAAALNNVSIVPNEYVATADPVQAPIQQNPVDMYQPPVQQPMQQVQVQPVQQAPMQQPVPAAVPTQVPMQQAQPVQQQPMQQPPVQTAPQAVPTSAPAYSMDQLAVAATQLMDAGKRESLLQLLATFGVQALTALPQEQYGAFATKLRELGANI